MSSEGVNDELEKPGVHALDALLDHVVAVLVLDALEDVALELGDDDLLLVHAYRLQRLLDHPTPVHLEGQRLNVGPKLKKIRWGQ